jgi:hypothetical protein
MFAVNSLKEEKHEKSSDRYRAFKIFTQLFKYSLAKSKNVLKLKTFKRIFSRQLEAHLEAPIDS